MKRIIFLFILTIVMAAAQAHPPMPEGPDMPNRQMRHGQRHHRPPFDPAKFEKELEQFIVTEAALTPSASAAACTSSFVGLVSFFNTRFTRS